METLRTVWYDIKRDLKQNKDDLEIPDAQGFYWTLMVGDRLRMQHILKRRSGAFLTTFVLPVLADQVFSERRYITLPKAIYDFDLDGGVQSISYFVADSSSPDFKRVEAFRTDPSRLRTRSMSAYQRATSTHPYFWREHSRLYLDGVHLDLENVEVKLLTTLPTLSELDAEGIADQPFDFPSELLFPLKEAIKGMGRFALAIPGQYLVNDGTNRNSKQVAGVPEKTTSVNDPLVNTGS